MKIDRALWTLDGGWSFPQERGLGELAQWVLVFGGKSALRRQLDPLRKRYPNAVLTGCSTSGEIYGTQVFDETLSVVAVSFEHTGLRVACREITSAERSFDTGRELAKELKEGLTSDLAKGPADSMNGGELSHLFLLSDGLHVNGSQLSQGIKSGLNDNIAVTGGLAGDGDRFGETLIAYNDEVASGRVLGVGFYGSALKVGCGSMGGWDVFGMDKTITKSKGNILYELDGKSALQVYKRYLGDMAGKLPASGLLFPLEIHTGNKENGVVRTILGVDEKNQSLTFAGDVPEGSTARLMKANFSRLVNGAVGAARQCIELAGSNPELAILISCVGRKLILKQRIEEEVEGVRDVLGPRSLLTGFYSYGELSPSLASGHSSSCELHNQTMTITTFSER